MNLHSKICLYTSVCSSTFESLKRQIFSNGGSSTIVGSHSNIDNSIKFKNAYHFFLAQGCDMYNMVKKCKFCILRREPLSVWRSALRVLLELT